MRSSPAWPIPDSWHRGIFANSPPFRFDLQVIRTKALACVGSSPVMSMTVDSAAWTRHFDTVCARLQLPTNKSGMCEDIRHGHAGK